MTQRKYYIGNKKLIKDLSRRWYV